MKLPMGKSTQRFLLWGIALSALHFVMTVALRGLMEWTNDVLFRSNIPTFLMDDRVHVVREFTMASLMLLHLPLVLAERWIGSVTPVTLWTFFAADALVYGFGSTTLAGWLKRPPRFFARYALPGITRRTVSLVVLLAIGHVAASVAIYFGALWTAARGPGAHVSGGALTILTVLHPWLLEFPLRSYAAAEPVVITIAVLDGLVWGLFFAGAIALLRRMLR